VDIFGDPWKGVILFPRMEGAKRFNEVQTLLIKVSQRILSLTQA